MSTLSLWRALRSRYASILFSAALALVCLPVLGQFGASITGTVQDPTQAVIPNATVTLTNTDTQQVTTQRTGPSGVYRFSSLPNGNYTLSVSAQGFTASSAQNIALAAETARNVDITMGLAGSQSEVTVNASEVQTLQSADANVGSTITNEEITRLPTFGADPYELLRTAPGIVGDAARSGSGQAIFLPNGAGPGGSNAGVYQTENQVQISAAGQRVADNNYQIDGVSVNSLTHGGSAVVTPNTEAVASIQAISTSFDAADGRNTGAQIKVVTNSGTNKVHGTASFLYDEPGLNAYNKYGGPAPGTLPTRVQNKQRTWAASIGGPLWKDKLFFFGSFQEFKQRQNTSTTALVETSAFRTAIQQQRAGGISAAIVADPNSQPRIVSVLTPSCTGFGTYTDTAGVQRSTCRVVAGGLDIGSLTPGGTTQLGVYPSGSSSVALGGASPQQVGGGFDGIPDLQNVQLLVPSQSRGNQYNSRIDWQITPNDLLAGSVYFTKLSTLGTSGTAGSRPQADLPFKPLNSAGTLIYIHTFSPSWINEVRANITRFADNQINDAGNTVNFGIPFVNVQNYPSALQFGVNYGQTSPAIFAQNTYEVRDTVTHSFGAHSLRMGVELRFEQDNDNLSGEQRPLYATNGLWAFANDAPVYEMVNANPLNGGVPITQRYFRSGDYAGFVQHDWKVTPNFTFNVGLRYEMFTPLRNKGFAVNYPVLGPAGQELSGMKLVPRDNLWNLQHNNWGPRVAFAYMPAMFNQKLVVRGGYSLAYNHLDIALFNPALENGPGIANFGLCCASSGTGPNSAGVKYELGTTRSPASFPINPVLATGVNPATGFPNSYTFPGTTTSITPSVEVYGAPPTIKYPSADLYSLEVQREVGKNMVAIVGYQGSTGHHFARLVNQNFLYNSSSSPTYASYFAQTDSVQNYNGLNVELRRTMHHNLGFSAVYTYSKSMDQVSNGDQANSNGNQTDPANNRTEYGPSDYDAKHRLTVTGLFQTPSLHRGNAVVKAFANGWQGNVIYQYHTGFPWTPVTNSLNSNPFTTGAATINPTRPLAYYGGAGTSCSTDAFKSGSNFGNRSGAGGGSNYFSTTLPAGNQYRPGIGRNSFRGPCYQNVDISVAKEFGYDVRDHHTLLRLQANLFNAFNILQLQPLTNGNANGGSNIGNQYFGYSQGADAGRIIELQARIQF